MIDPFDEQKIIYQANEYRNVFTNELSYGHLCRCISEAKTFKNKKIANEFIRKRFAYPAEASVKIIPITTKILFQAKLEGK